MSTNSNNTNAASQNIRDASHEELITVDGGQLSFEMRIYGYDLWIGAGGIAVCGPENCSLAMWSQLFKGM